MKFEPIVLFNIVTEGLISALTILIVYFLKQWWEDRKEINKIENERINECERDWDKSHGNSPRNLDEAVDRARYTKYRTLKISSYLHPFMNLFVGLIASTIFISSCSVVRSSTLSTTSLPSESPSATSTTPTMPTITSTPTLSITPTPTFTSAPTNTPSPTLTKTPFANLAILEVTWSNLCGGMVTYIPEGFELWLLVEQNNALHPQPGGPLYLDPSGEFEGICLIGISPTQNVGEEFTVYTVLVDPQGSQIFTDYLDTAQQNGYPGFKKNELPQSHIIIGSMKVRRKEG